eukprot:g6660.t1
MEFPLPGVISPHPSSWSPNAPQAKAILKEMIDPETQFTVYLVHWFTEDVAKYATSWEHPGFFSAHQDLLNAWLARQKRKSKKKKKKKKKKKCSREGKKKSTEKKESSKGKKKSKSKKGNKKSSSKKKAGVKGKSAKRSKRKSTVAAGNDEASQSKVAEDAQKNSKQMTEETEKTAKPMAEKAVASERTAQAQKSKKSQKLGKKRKEKEKKGKKEKEVSQDGTPADVDTDTTQETVSAASSKTSKKMTKKTNKKKKNRKTKTKKKKADKGQGEGEAAETGTSEQPSKKKRTEKKRKTKVVVASMPAPSGVTHIRSIPSSGQIKVLSKRKEVPVEVACVHTGSLTRRREMARLCRVQGYTMVHCKLWSSGLLSISTQAGATTFQANNPSADLSPGKATGQTNPPSAELSKLEKGKEYAIGEPQHPERKPTLRVSIPSGKKKWLRYHMSASMFEGKKNDPEWFLHVTLVMDGRHSSYAQLLEEGKILPIANGTSWSRAVLVYPPGPPGQKGKSSSAAPNNIAAHPGPAILEEAKSASEGSRIQGAISLHGLVKVTILNEGTPTCRWVEYKMDSPGEFSKTAVLKLGKHSGAYQECVDKGIILREDVPETWPFVPSFGSSMADSDDSGNYQAMLDSSDLSALDVEEQSKNTETKTNTPVARRTRSGRVHWNNAQQGERGESNRGEEEEEDNDNHQNQENFLAAEDEGGWNEKEENENYGENVTNENEKENQEGEEPRFCFCRGAEDGRLMIQCEDCEEWYHHDCVGMDHKLAKTLPHFFCQRCRPILWPATGLNLAAARKARPKPKSVPPPLSSDIDYDKNTTRSSSSSTQPSHLSSDKDKDKDRNPTRPDRTQCQELGPQSRSEPLEATQQTILPAQPRLRTLSASSADSYRSRTHSERSNTSFQAERSNTFQAFTTLKKREQDEAKKKKKEKKNKEKKDKKMKKKKKKKKQKRKDREGKEREVEEDEEDMEEEEETIPKLEQRPEEQQQEQQGHCPYVRVLGPPAFFPEQQPSSFPPPLHQPLALYPPPMAPPGVLPYNAMREESQNTLKPSAAQTPSEMQQHPYPQPSYYYPPIGPPLQIPPHPYTSPYYYIPPGHTPSRMLQSHPWEATLNSLSWKDSKQSAKRKDRDEDTQGHTVGFRKIPKVSVSDSGLAAPSLEFPAPHENTGLAGASATTLATSNVNTSATTLPATARVQMFCHAIVPTHGPTRPFATTTSAASTSTATAAASPNDAAGGDGSDKDAKQGEEADAASPSPNVLGFPPHMSPTYMIHYSNVYPGPHGQYYMQQSPSYYPYHTQPVYSHGPPSHVQHYHYPVAGAPYGHPGVQMHPAPVALDHTHAPSHPTPDYYLPLASGHASPGHHSLPPLEPPANATWQQRPLSHLPT